MELVAEVIEPLADVVARQRARADWMLENDPQFVALAKYEASQRRILGDGSDDSDND
jgi:hypothetical protein